MSSHLTVDCQVCCRAVAHHPTAPASVYGWFKAACAACGNQALLMDASRAPERYSFNLLDGRSSSRNPLVPSVLAAG